VVKITIPPHEILCLIPMKGITDAKKRLRVSFPSEKQEIISNLVISLFINTINIVRSIYDFAVVSPSENILEQALDKGTSFIYQDLGIDLNDALFTSITYASITSRWKYVLILTADLPFLSEESFYNLRQQFIPDQVCLIAAPVKNAMQGTSGLLIPFRMWSQITLEFGQDSFNKFIKQFSKNKIDFYSIKSEVGFDLDTIEDLNEFKAKHTNSPSHIINEGTLTQLFN